MALKAEEGQLLKLTLFAKRKQGMSEDDFGKYWTEKHAPLVKEWLAKHGIVRYAQVHHDDFAYRLCCG